MGVGDALGSIFGGGNDFQATMPPILGAPRGPNESAEEYANRLYQNYNSTNQGLTQDITQAKGQTLPQNILDFSQANQTAGQQGALNNSLQSRMNQNVNFGTQGTMGQEQGLINQLLAQGQGKGPNPALDQLKMTTDQNIRSAAGFVGSQRGINPALASRIIGQQTAMANQNAAGQASLQSAQQQLGAQQLGGQLLGQQIGQQTQQGALNAQQQALYSQLLAGQLGQQRGQDIGQAQAQGQAGLNLLTARTNEEAIRRQAQQAYQNQIANIYNSMNSINAGVSAQNASQNFQFGMGAMSGLSSGLEGAAHMFSEGGEVNPFVKNVEKKKVKKMAMGGASDGGMGAFLNYQQSPENAYMGVLNQAGQAASASGEKLKQSLDKGVSAGLGKLLSSIFPQTPGPIGGTPSLMGVQGGDPFKFGADPVSPMGAPGFGFTGFGDGGKIEGRAKVPGDSEKNDTVPALLSPGEVVIPRSAMGSAEDAHAFLDKVIAKHEGPNYKDVMKSMMKYHNMAHGGDIQACGYCHGGMN